MYEAFYKLTTKPFRLSPDPQFFYPSHGHKRALSYLLYGLNQGEGFVVITGAPGTGKTTLSHKLLSQIDEQSILVAHLASTQIEAEDLLRLVAASFKLRSENVSKAGLLRDIESFLLARAREHKRCLLVVDEAQNLPPRSMEELRMLSNFQTGSKALLQIFLLGQQQFRSMLNDPDFEQLRQRVIADYHLNPMDMDETRHYIDARLQTTGWQNDPLFDSGAYASIYEYTSGLPRRINMFCDRLMLFGYLEGLHLFTRESVLSVVAELENEAPFPNNKQVSPADSLMPRIVAVPVREVISATSLSGVHVGAQTKPVLVSATARPKPVLETTSPSTIPYTHTAAARAPTPLKTKEELLAPQPRASQTVQPAPPVHSEKSEPLREPTANTKSKISDNLLSDFLSEDLLAQHENSVARNRGRLASLALTESQWLIVLVVATTIAALLILTFWVYPTARDALYPTSAVSTTSSDIITTDISDLLHKPTNDTEITGAVERGTENKLSTNNNSAMDDDTGATLIFAEKSPSRNGITTSAEGLGVISRNSASTPSEKRNIAPPRIPEVKNTKPTPSVPPAPVSKTVVQEPVATEIVAPPSPVPTAVANVATMTLALPASDISERELALLLVKFARFYEQGDLTAFLKLFDPLVKTEDHNDIAAVSDDYSALFKKTSSREIILGDISWATIGEQMQGFGSFEVRIRGTENSPMSVLKGTITFHVQRKDGRLVITQLLHKPG